MLVRCRLVRPGLDSLSTETCIGWPNEQIEQKFFLS